MCWALGAMCLSAGLGLPWAAARVVGTATMVETVLLRPALVRLPGGRFWMKGEAIEVAPDPTKDVKTQLKVDVSTAGWVELSAFSVCKTEVTQAHYEAVMGTNPSDCDFGCGTNLPVQSVSWNDAVAYLNRLTELESESQVAEGEAPLSACYEGSGAEVRWVVGCTGYRLPTEAEWEYAARAGTTTSWSFGEDPAVDGGYAWYSGNAGAKVHAVGGLKANPWGLYDLHGNVWEWVWDSYDSYKRGNVVNSVGTARVFRGGAFGNPLGNLRSAIRIRATPERRTLSLGFRCARGSGPQR